MAEEDDCTTCYVCLEDFEENGRHVPRILPCHHSLCEYCLGEMSRGTSLNCPECRARHIFDGDVRSFPQNKYILAYIRRMALMKMKEGAMKFEICREHVRDLSLYCHEEQCGKVICQLCLLKEHRMHDVVDIEEVETRKLREQEMIRKNKEKLERQREMEEMQEHWKKGEPIYCRWRPSHQI